MKFKYLLAAAIAVASVSSTTAQERRNKANGPFVFTVVKEVGNTTVKNQGHTNTCWSFSALSFYESELMRMGKGYHNLSEMFVVNKTYLDKADKYVRMQGKVNFGPGGAFHDVNNCLRNYGMVPEEAYQTKVKIDDKDTMPDHAELEKIGSAFLDAILKGGGAISPSWRAAYEGIINGYLGQAPNEFKYQGKTYTPATFAKSVGLDANNYIEITSFTHHPFYSKFVLEVPDNWNADQVYNVQLDEMMQVIDNAVMNGYTVAWASDVSERGFGVKEAVALVPQDDKIAKDKMFDGTQPEKMITQELRQQAFDNQTTQDDHGMQIVGIAKDQKGVKYYIVKNSWGSTVNECNGYFYASESYVRYKTTSIMVHKSSVPNDIAKKLALK